MKVLVPGFVRSGKVSTDRKNLSAQRVEIRDFVSELGNLVRSTTTPGVGVGQQHDRTLFQGS